MRDFRRRGNQVDSSHGQCRGDILESSRILFAPVPLHFSCSARLRGCEVPQHIAYTRETKPNMKYIRLTFAPGKCIMIFSVPEA
jgi:hypothetical protein